jgi:hypothetical protein
MRGRNTRAPKYYRLLGRKDMYQSNKGIICSPYREAWIFNFLYDEIKLT